MKKTITTIAMVTVFTFGATFANATDNTGILVGDRTGTTAPCAEKDLDGILVGDLVGSFIGFLEGILVGDKVGTPCIDKDGIIYGG